MGLLSMLNSQRDKYVPSWQIDLNSVATGALKAIHTRY